MAVRQPAPSGNFFVTICTKGREFFLGKIEDEQMHLSVIGKYAEEQFRDVSLYYPYAEIPSYVVMPNHIHAIVIINDRSLNDHDACRDANLSRLEKQHYQFFPIFARFYKAINLLQ